MNGAAHRPQRGFTLLELLMAMAVFVLICAAMFGLLQLSQQKYSSESQLSGTFQEARLAMDQIVRDVNDAGYPPLSFFSGLPADPAQYAFNPFAWWPGYSPTSPVDCQIGTGGGGTCVTPSDFDLIVETTVGSAPGTGVSWIRYQLAGNTLMRGVVTKSALDPISATNAAGVMVPFLSNVMNQPSAAQLAQIQAAYPAMFASGQAVPIFQYMCDSPSGPVACPLAGLNNSPTEIRDVDITLIVATPQRDTATQRWNIVQLNGRGHRLNPSK